MRTIQRWVSAYEAEGEVGLLSAKAIQSALGSEKFALFEQTASDIMREYTDLSKPTMDLIINHAAAANERHLRQGCRSVALISNGIPNPAEA